MVAQKEKKQKKTNLQPNMLFLTDIDNATSIQPVVE